MITQLKPTRLQVVSFISSMPIIDFILNYILFDDTIFERGQIWLISFPLISIIGIGSWRTQVTIQNLIQFKYPALKQTRTRVALLASIIVPVMSLSVIFIFFIYDYFHLLNYRIKPNDIEFGLLVGFSVNLIFVTLYEVDYVVERLKESIMEKRNA